MRSVFFDEGHNANGTPLLIHLAAISANYNRVDYALECSIASVKPGPFYCVYLNPLVPDESQAGSSCIQLVLHGRWKNVCASILNIDSKLRVECAKVSEVVTTSDTFAHSTRSLLACDSGMHAFQLELLDPPGAREAMPRMKLYGFDQSGALVVASHNTLDRPMQLVSSLSHSLPVPTGGMGTGIECDQLDTSCIGRSRVLVSKKSALLDPSPLGMDLEEPTFCSQAVALPREKKRNKKMAAPQHEYVDELASLWREAEENQTKVNGKKVNVYGVVVDARGPCITKGSDLRSEVVIADPSSVNPSSGSAGLRTLTLHRFEALPQDAIPFRAIGDVIRAHRVELNVYDDAYAGTRMVQAGGKFFSTYLLWAGESDSDKPIATVEPVRTCSSASRPVSVEHTITDDDKKRVAGLRKWSSAYLNASNAVGRPYLKTIRDLPAHFSGPHAGKPFDIVCCFIGQPKGCSGVHFVISDGVYPARGIVNGEKRCIAARGLPVDRLSGEAVGFEHFAPSWHLRPDQCPMWLLIRDAYCVDESGSIEIRLCAGAKTSTLVWLRAESPEVRLAMSQLTACSPHAVSGEPAIAGTEALRACAELGSDRRSRPELEPLSVPIGEKQKPAGDRALAGISVDQNGSSACDSIDKNASNSCQTNIISTHANEDKPPVPLSLVHRKVLELGSNTPPFRITVQVCAVKSPVTLSQSCRPACGLCKVFVSEPLASELKGLECRQCRTIFTGVRDTRLSWAFDIALILEDDLGTRIDAWVTGPEAATFFTGATAVDLGAPTSGDARNVVREHLNRMLSPGSVLDCSIVPFVYSGWKDVPVVACQIFGTALLPI